MYTYLCTSNKKVLHIGDSIKTVTLISNIATIQRYSEKK